MHDVTRPRDLLPVGVLVPVAGAAREVELDHVHPSVTVDVECEVDE
jgi:hypothetical protein